MKGIGRLRAQAGDKSPLDILLAEPRIGRMTEAQRVRMTTSCSDTDYIPKVKEAGKVKKINGQRIQVLHNGLRVEADGYVGPWMTEVIKSLKGHHEPQEEKVFYEVVRRLTPGAVIIELGSYWAYYSLWVAKETPRSRAICIEPDDSNRKLGERNAKLNGVESSVTFLKGAAGSEHGKTVDVTMDSDPSKTSSVPVLSVDGLVREHTLKRLDILHMDVQGYELDTLRGAVETMRSGKLRFLFVSTHHYLFSKSPMTHADCLEFIKNEGGHIISSHTIPESFSGDGLIVASFSNHDKDFKVETSLNHVDEALFRTYEEDLQILIDHYQRRHA